MFMFILSFLAVKPYVWKNAEFFRIWPNFFQKFADNSFLGPGNSELYARRSSAMWPVTAKLMLTFFLKMVKL
jgi:hypothetical protein